MAVAQFPVIDLTATGRNITRLRKAKGLSVRDIQAWYGFEEPQAIYRWQYGKTLPSVDNLYALSVILEVPMERILIPVTYERVNQLEKQQEAPAASAFYSASCFHYICPPSARGGGKLRTGCAFAGEQ